MRTTHPYESNLQGHTKLSNRGSAIAVVAIIMALLSIVVGSLLNSSVHEQRMNDRWRSMIEGRNAVESILEIAWQNGVNSLRNATSIVGGIPIDLSLTKSEAVQVVDGMKHVIEAEVVATAPTVIRRNFYIDPINPENADDPQRGATVLVSEWDITAKTRTTHSTIQAKQTLQMRESPFFRYVAFFNMDTEFFPWPEMIFDGQVHANGNITVGGKDGLYLAGPVTATGQVSLQPENSLENVYFNNGLYEGGDATRVVGGQTVHFSDNEALDGTKPGLVFDNDDGVTPVLPPGMQPYVPASAGKPAENHGYALIEPVQMAVVNGAPNPHHKGDVEKEKFAYKAGINLKVVYSPGGAPPDSNAVRLIESGTTRSPGNLTDYYVIPEKIKRTNPHDFSTTTYQTVSIPDGQGGTSEFQNPVIDPVTIAPEVVDSFLTVSPYEEISTGNGPGAGTVSEGGIHDGRRDKPIDLVKFDVQGFDSSFVNQSNPSSAFSSTYYPSADYNGVVYVEFPTETPDASRKDKIVVADDDIREVQVDGEDTMASVGLLLSNGEKLPDPTYNDVLGRAPGFTVATNQQLYIHGNYNADGNPATGNARSGDDQTQGYSVLAAVAADAVTILSPEFDFSESKLPEAPAFGVGMNGDPPDTSTFTEVNTAILTGHVPEGGLDDSGNTWASGGVQNLPRFLEDWGGTAVGNQGTTFRYTGSLVGFFLSEVATEDWDLTYFRPPVRDWAFFHRFGKGEQPPGTPVARFFDKTNFEYVMN